jgi:hypothetical protein
MEEISPKAHGGTQDMIEWNLSWKENRTKYMLLSFLVMENKPYIGRQYLLVLHVQDSLPGHNFRLLFYQIPQPLHLRRIAWHHQWATHLVHYNGACLTNFNIHASKSYLLWCRIVNYGCNFFRTVHLSLHNILLA